MPNRVTQLAIRFLFLRKLGARWAKPLVQRGIRRLPPAREDDKGALHIEGLGTPIPEPNEIGLAFLINLRPAIDLHKRAGAIWTFEPNSALVEVGGVKLRILNSSDINVVHEVFVERLYSFGMPGTFMVLDLGANIGASMLFFAKQYDAEVEGYELVPTTAAIAQANLDLNPEIARGCRLFPFGLGPADDHVSLTCDAAFRPSNSLFPTPEGFDAPWQSAGTSVEEVTVRDVVPVVERALASLGKRKLVLKMDVEGAEFGLLRRLASADLLKRIDLILLEWHRIPGESGKEIERTLTESGFNWFGREHGDVPVGFITAIRANR